MGDILMSHATEAGNINARFHGDDLARLENGFCKSGSLVNLEAKPVAGSMEKSLPATI